MINIDALAQEIRRVDGDHSLGAGALAEALLPFIQASAKPMGVNFTWGHVKDIKTQEIADLRAQLSAAHRALEAAERLHQVGLMNASAEEIRHEIELRRAALKEGSHAD